MKLNWHTLIILGDLTEIRSELRSDPWHVARVPANVSDDIRLAPARLAQAHSNTEITRGGKPPRLSFLYVRDCENVTL